MYFLDLGQWKANLNYLNLAKIKGLIFLPAFQGKVKNFVISLAIMEISIFPKVDLYQFFASAADKRRASANQMSKS